MRNRRIRDLLVFMLIIAITLGSGTSHAQKVKDISVTEAVPAQAEQGVLELDVEITGSGFDSSVQATFFVAGSETDTGEVEVLDNQFINPKKMKSRIKIPESATIGDYDIEVRASGGRRGKGNTLFRVLEKDSGGGNSSHYEAVPLCISVEESLNGADLWADSAGTPYCDGEGSRASLESFEGSLRFNPNAGTRKNPSDRFLLSDAEGCSDRACDESEVGAISTEREHHWDGAQFSAGGTAVFWDMLPGQVTRVEGKVLLDRYRAFQYSTPNSDRITCPTHQTAPLWLRCDGKSLGGDTSTTCDRWTLSSYALVGDGSGDAFPCLDNDQRSQIIEAKVELDFMIRICVRDESCPYP